MFNNVYPFFLDNIKFGSAFYLYEVVSPGIKEDLTPLMSIKKVGERTRKNDPSYDEKLGFNDLDILTVLTKTRPKDVLAYLNEDIINKDKEVRKKEVKLYNMGDRKFPAYEISNLTTKATIIGIRDNLRWQYYKFHPGKLIDILTSPTTFGVYEIVGDENEVWLEHRNSYSTNDPGMINPLDEEPTLKASHKFKGTSKTSDMNRFIRAREWRALDSID